MAAGRCAHSDGLDFSQDVKQLEGPNDWMCLAVIGQPSWSDRWATAGVGFRKSMPLWGIMLRGVYVALKHSLYTIDDLKQIGQINANLLHSDDEINPSSVKPLLLVSLPLYCSQLLNVCKHDSDEQLGHMYEPLSWTWDESTGEAKTRIVSLLQSVFFRKLVVCTRGQQTCRESAVLDHVLLPLF